MPTTQGRLPRKASRSPQRAACIRCSATLLRSADFGAWRRLDPFVLRLHLPFAGEFSGRGRSGEPYSARSQPVKKLHPAPDFLVELRDAWAGICPFQLGDLPVGEGKGIAPDLQGVGRVLAQLLHPVGQQKAAAWLQGRARIPSNAGRTPRDRAARPVDPACQPPIAEHAVASLAQPAARLQLGDQRERGNRKFRETKSTSCVASEVVSSPEVSSRSNRNISTSGKLFCETFCSRKRVRPGFERRDRRSGR